MKIYTKSGDKGETSLFGGERVKKNHLSIHAYGTVDELNSWIGLIKDTIDDKHNPFLIKIQEQLFTIGSYLATGDNKKMIIHLPKLSDSPVLELENAIDVMQESLPSIISGIGEFAKLEDIKISTINIFLVTEILKTILL